MQIAWKQRRTPGSENENAPDMQLEWAAQYVSGALFRGALEEGGRPEEVSGLDDLNNDNIADMDIPQDYIALKKLKYTHDRSY
ncbi:hypothetical protein [Roseibium sp. RKSG952]|uniref:hypothetical protein n=1 Tax=Roseibium sp. RKSG952 TaxID=2529384 RepID=UPI0012BCCD6C|nr:hypothetical protein [Roseibium sp. RKSG952]MTH96467.1 hypothetical protein [Roseibium sp. RKSG952]